MSKRQKKPEKEGNHERWLISYADFITLLFAVFVTLYAMSQTDKKKTDQLVASLRESFGMVKTGASAEKISLIETTDLRSIPSVRQQVITPGMRHSQDKPGQALNEATANDFQAIKDSIE